MMQGKMNPIPTDFCRAKYISLGVNYKSLPADFDNHSICAGTSGSEIGVNLGAGDSGGPLVCKQQNDVWTVVGVASWGIRNDLSIFSKLTNSTEWLQAIMKIN
jgi:secreted trypsin-like serine protease